MYIPLTRDVPQGSVLGPLLFSILTCNLTQQIETCNIHINADDTQLYHSLYYNEYMQAFLQHL